MLRSVWILFVYIAFIVLGVQAPFVLTLGYVWVDTFQPQAVSYIILNQLPVAMIMGALALGAYLLVDRRSPPYLNLGTILQVSIGIWVTLTLIWAEVPDAAWFKWDWAAKTIMFASFLPFVIRSRIHIEAFVQTYVLSLAANIIPFGIKTLISGGGYGSNLGLQAGNSGLAEGGLLSTVCLMIVPLAIYLAKHSQLMPRGTLTLSVYWGLAGLAIITAIGTYERSALVGLVVLIAYMWIRSRHKLGFGMIACFVACLVIYSTSSAWNARVATIGHFEQENSAYVRILVWKWTLAYVAEHPLGGGFQANLVDTIEVPANETEPAMIQTGRAFHSIYFEVLGEHGYPGLLLFLALAGVTFVRLRRIARKARRREELYWIASLSDALQAGLAVFLTSGAFVGIAFQPMFWYFTALAISLDAYMARVENPNLAITTGWRKTNLLTQVQLAPQLPKKSWRGRAVARSDKITRSEV